MLCFVTGVREGMGHALQGLLTSQLIDGNTSEKKAKDGVATLEDIAVSLGGKILLPLRFSL